jgi:hypothetical protein
MTQHLRKNMGTQTKKNYNNDMKPAPRDNRRKSPPKNKTVDLAPQNEVKEMFMNYEQTRRCEKRLDQIERETKRRLGASHERTKKRGLDRSPRRWRHAGPYEERFRIYLTPSKAS